MTSGDRSNQGQDPLTRFALPEQLNRFGAPPVPMMSPSVWGEQIPGVTTPSANPGIMPSSPSPVAPGSSSPTPAPNMPETSPHTSEPFPNVPQSSSRLNDVMDAQHRLDALGEEPTSVKPNWKLRLAAMLAAGAAGWNHENGMPIAQAILNMPLERAQAAWKAKEAPLERNYQEAVQGFDLGLSQDRETREAAAENAAQKTREETLGIDKQRLQNQIDSQNKEYDIRKQELEDEKLKNARPTNETELALQATEVGPDGKSTPGAISANRALKVLQQQKIDQIHATRDPQERSRLLVDYQTNLTQVRAQLDRQLDSIQNNPMSRTDPAAATQMKNLQGQLAGIDEDLKYIHGELGKAGGFAPPSTQQQGTPPPLTPPAKAQPGMKWQHRTVNGKVEWRQVQANPIK